MKSSISPIGRPPAAGPAPGGPDARRLIGETTPRAGAEEKAMDYAKIYQTNNVHIECGLTPPYTEGVGVMWYASDRANRRLRMAIIRASIRGERTMKFEEDRA